MWHSRVFEGIFIGATIIIIILGGVLCGVFTAISPEVFKYGSEDPPDLSMKNLHLNVGMLKAELLVPNQDTFKIYGIQISED